MAVARNLQAELEAQRVCEVTRWDVDVFEPSGTTLESLLRVSSAVDFAILVATPDDVTEIRGERAAVVRDNVLLEFGLFTGALGRARTYLLATDPEVRLPTDLLGLTQLRVRARSDGNVRASLNEAVLAVERQVAELGQRPRDRNNPSEASEGLDRELALLRRNAVAQGWQVRADSDTTLRLVSPRGRVHTLRKKRAHQTREDLRLFAERLNADGLRVNSAIKGPVEDSPL